MFVFVTVKPQCLDTAGTKAMGIHWVPGYLLGGRVAEDVGRP